MIVLDAGKGECGVQPVPGGVQVSLPDIGQGQRHEADNLRMLVTDLFPAIPCRSPSTARSSLPMAQVKLPRHTRACARCPRLRMPGVASARWRMRSSAANRGELQPGEPPESP